MRAFNHLLVFALDVALIRFDVLKSFLHLRGRQSQMGGNGVGSPTQALIIEDVVNGDAGALDFRAAAAIVDFRCKQRRDDLRSNRIRKIRLQVFSVFGGLRNQKPFHLGRHVNAQVHGESSRGVSYTDRIGTVNSSEKACRCPYYAYAIIADSKHFVSAVALARYHFYIARISDEESAMRCTFVSLLTLLFVGALGADGPKDNLSDNVRPVPPPGIKIAAEDREALEKGLETLRAAIDHVDVQAPREFRELLPDVEIYYKAVHDALHYNEFYNQKEIAVAKNLLKTGLARAQALAEGKHPWTTQTGFVVRGYRSKIDRSVQPFGLVIPKSFDFSKKIRLDFWCHGRGENLTELNFIQSCQSSGGPFASEKAIVLNLYGRYCCANKLAGEVDCFEALDAVKKHYPIDEDRLVMRGFSMGGAACWQFAVHYPSVWCAAAPGAGFAETPEFLKVFQNESVSPTWYEKKLWHMYDCTDYALNIFNLPTVAYSGEIDSQKQAADIMAKAMKGEGLELVHIIGPKTGHGYEKGAKALLIEQIDKILEQAVHRVSLASG